MAQLDSLTALLLEGRAATAEEAEQQYLQEHLDDILELAAGPLSDAEFRRHPLIVLLLSHGSRGWDDSVL